MAALGKIATRCRGGTALPRLCNLSRLCLPASRSLQVRYATSETVTHTGQKFEDDDFRKARFIDRTKEVNLQFAEQLIAEEPPKEVEGRVVWCDGGGGALGHPKVYINLDQEGPHSCGYCGLRFDQEGPHSCGYCGLRFVHKPHH